MALSDLGEEVAGLVRATGRPADHDACLGEEHDLLGEAALGQGPTESSGVPAQWPALARQLLDRSRIGRSAQRTPVDLHAGEYCPSR